MSSIVNCKEYNVPLLFTNFMAHPRGSSKAPRPRHRRRENLTSLSTEVLRLRLQALNLPITGSKAELISRLKAAVEQPRPTKQPLPSRVRKSMSKKSSRSDRDPVTARADGVNEVSDISRPLVLWMTWLRTM